MNQDPDPRWNDNTQWGGGQQWSNPPTSEFAAVPQGGYGGPPPKQGMSAGMAVLLTLMAVLIIGLIAAVVFLVVPRMTGTSASPTTSTVVATATAAPGQASQVQPAQAAPAPAPAASAPSGSYECTDSGGGFLAHSAVGSNVTSCEFASSVRSSYLSAGGDGGSRTVRAYSPVTGRTYTMSCSGGSVVTCTGGNNAVVYIY